MRTTPATMPAPAPGTPASAQQPLFVAATAVLLERWRLVVYTALIAAAVGSAIRVVMPRRYVASTVMTIMQSQTDPRAQMLMSQMSGLGPTFMSASADVKLVSTVVNSRSLADSMRNRFGTIGLASVVRTGDGSIVVEVRARDPRVAATAANTYPELLNAFLTRMNAEAGRRKQQVLREQVTFARQELDHSQQALVDFERSQNTPALEQQANRTVDAAAGLQEAIVQKEMSIAMLRRVATPENPQLRSATAELEGLRAQLARLASGGGEGQVLLSLHASPELRARSLRLLGEYTKDQQTYLSLLAALTQSQLDAANDLPVASVVDVAQVPKQPSGPGVPVIALLALILGAFAGAALALGSRRFQDARGDPRYAPVFQAWQRFRREVGASSPFRKAAAPAVAAHARAEHELG